jgi:hypothetical protein
MSAGAVLALALVLPACASVPTSVAGPARGPWASLWAPDGSTVVARAVDGGWTLDVLSPRGDVGAPRVADCDQAWAGAWGDLAPNPTWPATASLAATGQCATWGEAVMDTHGRGLAFVELRTSGDVGGAAVLRGPSASFTLECRAPDFGLAVPGAGGQSGWLETEAGPGKFCRAEGSAPGEFGTWQGWVRNDNGLGDTYAAAG